ncbi:MAG: Glutathione import ATP-binding protein GsiA, partial [Bacteroidota bacterium]
MANPILKINHLTVQFGQAEGHQVAVNDLSLQINRGEILALVGESGSGKSVTALSLMQLLPAHAKCSGEIIFAKA